MEGLFSQAENTEGFEPAVIGVLEKPQVDMGIGSYAGLELGMEVWVGHVNVRVISMRRLINAVGVEEFAY